MEKNTLSQDEIVGKQVIDSNGAIVGNVKEVTFDTALKTVALDVTVKKGLTITIEYDDIAVIGDVILLKPKDQHPTAVPTTPNPTTPGRCRNCNYQNDINAKFCIKCGTNLQ